MRIVVSPHDLGLGGSQLNAIEIAAGVRDLGHEVLVFGRSGALVERIRQLGLEFVEAPESVRRPSPTRAAALVELIDRRGIELIHGYEWPPTLDAELAAIRRPATAVVSTVMSMSVPPFIPRRLSLVVGTEEIAAHERALGRVRTAVIEPPVDLVHNDPAAVEGVDAFRQRFGIDPAATAIVSVTRFARELKLEGTLAAIDAVADLSSAHRVQLVLVGDGPARDEVERRAAAANARAGDGTIVLTGRLDDPRAAYAAADLALGMGGSALRALAFGSPLIVQGERGFWRLLTPETLDQFLWTGWYGIGDGEAGGLDALRSILGALLPDDVRRAQLSAFGRTLVAERFSLEAASVRQEMLYREALADQPGRAARRVSDAVGLARYSSYYARKRLRRALGRESTDDFNARPVTAVNRDVQGRRA